MGHRGLRKEIVEHNSPDLPEDFVRYVRENDITISTVGDLVSELQKWKQKEAS